MGLDGIRFSLLDFIALWGLAAGCATAGSNGGAPLRTIGGLEARDPRFHDLIAPDARIEVLAEGFDWIEGPVWVRDGGYLLFSDIPRNAIYAWKEGEGVSLFQKPSGYTGSAPRGGEPGSNGLALDGEGRLVLCEHGDRRVSRLESLANPNGPKTTLADRYEGKRLDSPNDLVFHSSGALYFTDPPYGLEGNVGDPAKELDFQGVFRLAPDGGLSLVDREIARPNGIALSPDERTLYVANSDPAFPVWYAFDLAPDGSATNKRIFHDARPWAAGRTGLPDGMKVDLRGNIFATGPGGVCVFAPDGTLLGTILTTQATANCAWGDDGSTLYIAADSLLLRIRTRTRGLGFNGPSEGHRRGRAPRGRPGRRRSPRRRSGSRRGRASHRWAGPIGRTSPLAMS